MPIRHRRIFLEDFSVPVSIGIHDHEKNGPQPVLINIELFVKDPGRPSADRIEDVLDYDFLRNTVREMIEGRHFNLQETLCETIIDALRSRPEIERAIVSTRKTEVYPDCRSVGFEINFESD